MNCTNWVDISEIVTVIVSVISVWISYKIHKQSTYNSAKAKQMEAMSLLVEELNKVKIKIDFYQNCSLRGRSGSSSNISYNIFEIGDLYVNPSKDEEFFNLSYEIFNDERVLLNLGSTQIIKDIRRFIDNPFTPKEIADELLNFYITSTKYYILTEEEVNLVLLTSLEEGYKGDNVNLMEGYAGVLLSWLHFKAHSYNLTSKISKWFLANGIHDFNFRIDFKNRIP